MYLLGNLVWMIFGGLVSFLLWTVAGLICCLTIVGIPFGLQCLKIASFILWPFGKDVEIGRFGVGGFIGNLLWILLLGWELALTHWYSGLFSASPSSGFRSAGSILSLPSFPCCPLAPGSIRKTGFEEVCG